MFRDIYGCNAQYSDCASTCVKWVGLKDQRSLRTPPNSDSKRIPGSLSEPSSGMVIGEVKGHLKLVKNPSRVCCYCVTIMVRLYVKSKVARLRGYPVRLASL